MARRVSSCGYQLLTEVLLSCQPVVSRATQREIRGLVRPALGERLHVVQLEVARLTAALTRSST